MNFKALLKSLGVAALAGALGAGSSAIHAGASLEEVLHLAITGAVAAVTGLWMTRPELKKK